MGTGWPEELVLAASSAAVTLSNSLVADGATEPDLRTTACVLDPDEGENAETLVAASARKTAAMLEIFIFFLLGVFVIV